MRYLGEFGGGEFEGEFGEDLVHLLARSSPWCPEVECDDL